eukprot:3884602-Amphidinium_carterae.1
MACVECKGSWEALQNAWLIQCAVAPCLLRWAILCCAQLLGAAYVGKSTCAAEVWQMCQAPTHGKSSGFKLVINQIVGQRHSLLNFVAEQHSFRGWSLAHLKRLVQHLSLKPARGHLSQTEVQKPLVEEDALLDLLAECEPELAEEVNC